jgi:hypothetical protein
MEEMANVDGISEMDYPEVEELMNGVREFSEMFKMRALGEGGGEDD